MGVKKMNTLSRKEEIITTASRLFRERGYSAVTMRDLAAEMGIKAASLYNHISSKQEILAAIIMPIATQFVTGIVEIIKEGSKAENQLKQVVAQHVRLTLHHPDSMAALNNDWMHLEGDLEHYLQMREQYEQCFKNIISRGITHKELHIPDEEVMLFSFLSTLRNLYLWIRKKPDRNEDALIFALSEILLHGVLQKT